MSSHVNRDIFSVWIWGYLNGIVFLRRGHGKIGGIEKVLRQFGFTSKNDYIHSYPGRFRQNTRQLKEYKYDAEEDPFKVIHKIGDEPKRIPSPNATIALSKNLCVVPTMKEMLRCNLYEGAEKKELWFCSDWSEEDQ